MVKVFKGIKSFLDVNFHPDFIRTNKQDTLRRIRMTNYISVISILNMLGYVLIYLLIDIKEFKHPILFLTAASLTNVFLIILNKRGFYKSSKVLLSVLTNLYMAYISVIVFGTKPEFQVYLLVGGIIPLFLWSFKQKLQLTIFISFALILYSIIEFIPISIHPLVDIPAYYVNIFRTTNIFICFMASGFAIGILQHFYNIQEKELIKQTVESKKSQAHKDKVYSIIAHDLRSPIGPFVGLTDIYLSNYESYSNEQRKESLYAMNKTSSSLQNLLENLLSWSKMHSGVIEQNNTNILIKEIAEKAVQLHQEQINKKKQNIELKIESKLCGIGDKYMVSTIFRNLISNAIKFTPEAGNIAIEAKNKDNYIEICVSDSGIGMSEEDILTLFDISKSTANSLNKGSGLGLLICKEFTERNNGEIWVDSKPKIGTKFYFTLLTVNT